MQSFLKFSEEEFLDESLNSPIEFDMTDDTQLPKQVFAIYEIDGTQYGMSLVQSMYDGVYILDLYRIVNVKKRSWSFLKPTHIRQSLSTVIKFMEATYPFIQAKMKGVIIELPGKKGSEKYISFLGRILKKSYIKKFREIPITKKSDKARNYMFLVRKDIAPANLFKTAAFHKNFEFDKNGDEIFTSDIMDQSAETYKKMKTNVSTNLSTKYVYGAIQVELVADDETISMLDAASEKFKIDSKIKKPEEKVEKEKEYQVVLVADMKDILSSGSTGTAGYFDNKASNTLSMSLAHLMAVILPNAHDKILAYGYDESKINQDDLKYAASEGFKSLSEKVKDALKDAGMFTTDGSLNTSPANMDSIKLSLASMMYVPKNQAIDLATIMNIKLASTIKKNSKKTKKVKEFKMDLDKFPASPLNSFDNANLPNTYNGELGFYEDNESVEKKKKDILKMPSVKKWYEEFNKNSYEIKQKSLYEYTGSTYKPMNRSLRKQIIDKKLSLDSLHKGYGVDTLELINYFREAPEIQNGMWVYRNADTPGVENYEVGDDYTDAAIMSTSINSRVSMGSNKDEGGPSNTRLKIYLPKGTKCFPILDKSAVSGEAEVVLPPFSLFRIMERYDNYRFDGHRMFVCTYVGSGMEHYLEAAEQGILLEGKTPKTEKEIKNAESKWSDPTISYEDAMAFKKLVLKINKNKK